MPSKSKAQHRFMEAAAHNPQFARKAGISQGVAREFADADASSKGWKKQDHVKPKGKGRG